MKVQLESTTKIVELIVNGNTVPARVWEGVTENGIPCHAFLTRIACKSNAQADEFERDLTETRVPSAEVAAFPMRMIL